MVPGCGPSRRWTRAALALVGALAVLVACRQAAPPAPPSPGPEAREVAFESEPPGAQVTVDGLRRGTTPCRVPLDPGRYRVSLRRAGYLPQEMDLIVRFGENARVSARLVASH